MQTSMTIDMVAALEGGLYDNGPNDIVSGVAEEDLKAGRFVVGGTADNQLLMPTADAEVSDGTSLNAQNVRGFTVRDVASEVDANGNLLYTEEAVVSVLRKGRIWVTCEDAFTPADPVFVVHTGAGQGLVRTDANTDKAEQLFGAKFLNSGGIAGLAIVEVNL